MSLRTLPATTSPSSAEPVGPERDEHGITERSAFRATLRCRGDRAVWCKCKVEFP